MFADDVLAATEAAGIGRFAAGGISMGAAIALRLAVRHPRRVGALLLVRPAWGFDPAPPNLAPVAEAARLLLGGTPGEARAAFAGSESAARLARAAPDNLASLLGYFERPDAAGFAEVISGIAADGPGVSADEAAAVAVPTLVIGNAVDAVHPLALARSLAAAIPGAAFRRGDGEGRRPGPARRGGARGDRPVPRGDGARAGMSLAGAEAIAALPRHRMLAEFLAVVGRSRQPRDGARAGGALRRPAPRRRCRRPLRPGLPVLSRPRRADRRADAPPDPRAPDGRGGTDVLVVL